MYKVVLPLFMLLFCVKLSAQEACIPDTTLADTVIIAPEPFHPDLRPMGGIQDTACLNTYFETTLQVRIPDTVGTIAINGVSLAPEGAIMNLPDGLEYVCNPPNCTFLADSVGCLTVRGTPTNSMQLGANDLELRFLFDTDLIDLEVTYPDRTGLLPETANGNYFLFVKEEGSENCFMGVTSTTDFVRQNLSIRNAPNPFSGRTNIEINSFISDDFDFKIYDLMGKELYRERVQITQGDNRLPFDGSFLPEGAYLYSLSNEKGIISSKMMINR